MNLRFYITDKNNRPIIDYNAMTILFDTGASTPVWCMGKKRFYGVFPDATKQKYKYLLSGFGRTEQELKDFILHPDKNKVDDFLMDVYNLSSFSLSDNKSTITWKNLKVVVTEKKEIGADLILPSTMFRGMELSWNQEYVNTPYIEIKSHTNIKYVFVQKCADKFFSQELLKYIYSQDNLEFEEITNLPT